MAKIKKVEEDLDEIKGAIDSMAKEVEKVVKQQNALMHLLDQITELKDWLKEKDKIELPER